MNEGLANKLLEGIYEEYAQKIITELILLGPDSMTSGSDSEYENVWEEYVSQIQGEESIFFELYEELILNLCNNLINSKGRNEIYLLWTMTEESFDYDEKDEDDSLSNYDIENDVANALFNKISTIAADFDLYEINEKDDKLLHWYNHDINEDELPEIRPIKQIQEFVDRYYGKEDNIEIPNWVRVDEGTLLVYPINLSLIETIDTGVGSDHEQIDSDIVTFYFRRVLLNLNTFVTDQALFRRLFIQYLDMEWEDYLDVEDPEEKLYTSYRTICNLCYYQGLERIY